jgi:hypothetical protein
LATNGLIGINSNVARTTIQRAVKTGRLSLDAEHRVDTAELLRIGYQLDAAALHAAAQHEAAYTQQNAALQHSITQQGAAAQELQVLRQERDALQQERLAHAAGHHAAHDAPDDAAAPDAGAADAARDAAPV